MALADESAPDAASLDYGDGEAVRTFLAAVETSAELVGFIDRLRRGVICPWCLGPLRASPECPDPLDDAAAIDWLPETVIEGVQRGTTRRFYCDRQACAKSGLVDSLAPGETRDRGQLHAHLDNLLAALDVLYGFDLPTDTDAAHDAIEDAIADDENGGKDSLVLAYGLVAALD